MKIKELEQWLKENESSNEIDIERIVIPSDPWSKQCMDAVSNDIGITDTMLELDKCLEDEVISYVIYIVIFK